MQRLQQLIAEFNRTDQVDPSQSILSKHQKMALNPFRFLRGSSGLFYADIQSGLLKLPPALLQQVPLTAVMGDCHLSNFGFFTEDGSYGERVIFAPNDFDDACIGPAVWDLSRYIVSLLLATDYCQGLSTGRYQSDDASDLIGVVAASTDDANDAARSFLQSYSDCCAAVAQDAEFRFSTQDDFPKNHVLKPFLKKAIKRSAAGSDFLKKSTLAKSVDISARPLQFKADAGKFSQIDAERYQQLKHTFAPYVHDEILDIVTRHGAGTGSLNMQRYYLLVGPADLDSDADLALCQVVEVKQQRRSAPLFFFPDLSPVNRLNDAHLTVDCQRLMQRRPDSVLDEVQFEGAHYLVRSLHHANVDVDPEDVCLQTQAPGQALSQYAAACGHALALAHNRADRRSARFARQMLETMATSHDALLQACVDYARQQQEDCRLLATLLKQTSERIERQQ
ncbi:MAG: DUF2252 family protein [Rheinheimera sp.]|nr:DUF2252 family protein [Rheinheimera sp.]